MLVYISKSHTLVCCGCPALPFKFVEGLKDTEALVSQDVTLTCTVSKDDVQLTWKKNGTEIKPDGKKYELVVDGTVHRLVIHDAQLDDDAEYQCCLGDDMSSCRLHVEGNPSAIRSSIFNETIAITAFRCKLLCELNTHSGALLLHVIGRLWAELSGRNVLPDWVMYEYCEYINQNDRIW